jgi:hypothetical protein
VSAARTAARRRHAHRDGVVRRVRPQPQDRGDGHGPDQAIARVLAAGDLFPGARRRRVVVRVVAIPAVPPAPAHRRARRDPGPRLLVQRAGEAASRDGAVPGRAGGDADQEPLRRQRVHVEHAVVGGEGPVAERAEAAAGDRRRGAEAGAAERGGPDGCPRQPQRRQHAAVVQPRCAAGGVRLQEGRRQPVRALVGGEWPGHIPAEEMVIHRLFTPSCRED